MTAPGSHIMILTGEPSGDAHGAALVSAIRNMAPDIRVTGIGGPAMTDAGVDCFFPIEKLSAMGITEVLGQFRTIKQAFALFREKLRTTRPDLLILVDYPGFNLRAAQFAKNHTSVRVFYYITPKVWAWNQRRLHKIRRFVDHAALIFPFEERLYRQYRIPATYVGNPLMDAYPEAVVIRRRKRLAQTSGQSPAKSPAQSLVVGLLPGSRKAEIDNLLAPMLAAAEKLHRHLPGTRFLVSAATAVPREKIDAAVAPHKRDGMFEIVPGPPMQIFEQAHMLVAASGTVTLEAALCGVPTIIVYKLSPLTFRVGKLLVRVKFAGLANLIAGFEVMPELLQDDADPDRICQKALEMALHLPAYAARLDIVRRLLGSGGASRRAARIALDLI